MRGIPLFNFPAFHKAAELLRAADHEVFSPAERDEAIYGKSFSLYNADGSEVKAELDYGFNLRSALRDDMNWICNEADGIALLNGWENSRGASAEAAVGKALGLIVGEVDVFLGKSQPSSVSKQRKNTPLWRGVLQYFPLALQAVARVSWKGNEKHNPGEPLHWARGKSMDQEDCIVRHMVNPYEPDPDTGELHIVHAAWRALAAAELALEKNARR